MPKRNNINSVAMDKPNIFIVVFINCRRWHRTVVSIRFHIGIVIVIVLRTLKTELAYNKIRRQTRCRRNAALNIHTEIEAPSPDKQRRTRKIDRASVIVFFCARRIHRQTWRQL